MKKNGSFYLNHNSIISFKNDLYKWSIRTSGKIIEDEVVADGGSTRYKQEFVNDYKLKLYDEKQGYSQLLVSFDKLILNGVFPSIVWVGDIDGDNKLDICLDINLNEIGAGTFVWYLSSKAEGDEVVQQVFKLRTLGC